MFPGCFRYLGRLQRRYQVQVAVLPLCSYFAAIMSRGVTPRSVMAFTSAGGCAVAGWSVGLPPGSSTRTQSERPIAAALWSGVPNCFPLGIRRHCASMSGRGSACAGHTVMLSSEATSVHPVGGPRDRRYFRCLLRDGAALFHNNCQWWYSLLENVYPNWFQTFQSL